MDPTDVSAAVSTSHSSDTHSNENTARTCHLVVVLHGLGGRPAPFGLFGETLLDYFERKPEEPIASDSKMPANSHQHDKLDTIESSAAVAQSIGPSSQRRNPDNNYDQKSGASSNLGESERSQARQVWCDKHGSHSNVTVLLAGNGKVKWKLGSTLDGIDNGELMLGARVRGMFFSSGRKRTLQAEEFQDFPKKREVQVQLTTTNGDRRISTLLWNLIF